MSAFPEKSSPSAVEKFSLNHAVLSATACGPLPIGRSLHTAPFRSRSVHSSEVPYQTCSNGGSGGYGSGGTKPGGGGTVTGQAFCSADDATFTPGVEGPVRSLAPAHPETMRPATNAATVVLIASLPWLSLLGTPASRDPVPIRRGSARNRSRSRSGGAMPQRDHLVDA